MAKYKIELCDDMNLWDTFVNESPQGTVFNNSNFLSTINDNNNYYFVKKGEEIVSAFTLILDLNNRPVKAIPFVPYFNNIMFTEKKSILAHKKISEEFKITELIINEVLTEFKEFHVTNSTEFKDIRPFIWYNYHEKEKGVFKNKICYTPILNLEDKNQNTLLSQLRYNRKSDMKKSSFLEVRESNDISVLNSLHEQTFNSHGINRTAQEKDLLFKITKNSLDFGYGRLAHVYKDDIPISSTLFLFDKTSSYYLFGASSPEHRNTGASTKLMYDNIIFFKKKGINKVDLIGANSPKRSDYKISFNADLKIYFSSSLNQSI